MLYTNLTSQRAMWKTGTEPIHSGTQLWIIAFTRNIVEAILLIGWTLANTRLQKNKEKASGMIYHIDSNGLFRFKNIDRYHFLAYLTTSTIERISISTIIAIINRQATGLFWCSCALVNKLLYTFYKLSFPFETFTDAYSMFMSIRSKSVPWMITSSFNSL